MSTGLFLRGMVYAVISGGSAWIYESERNGLALAIAVWMGLLAVGAWIDGAAD